MQTVVNLILFGVMAVAVIAICSLFFAMQPPAAPTFARARTTSSGTNQVRRDPNAAFLHDRAAFLFRKRTFFVGTGCPPVVISEKTLERMGAGQGHAPQHVASTGVRNWWWFEAEFYWASVNYDANDVLALLRDRQRRERAKLDRARTLLRVEQQGTRDGQSRGRRGPLPRELRRAVFERDGGRCVECGADFDIQYDHVIPVTLGGASTFENLQLLCGPCNLDKSANL